MNTEITFGVWLKRRRRQLDMTQKELAEAAVCGLGTLRKIERDTRRPSKELAAYIGAALDIPAEQMAAFVTFARSDPDMEAAPLPVFAQQQITPPQPSIPAVIYSNDAPKIRHNLPPQPTRFIGRDNEIGVLHDFLRDQDSRLITIVGPGGMGKTRLALACAEQLASPTSNPPFLDGLFFVDLAPISDSGHIVPTIAKTLDFLLQESKDEERSDQEQLLDYLREKQLLLILDNFEQLIVGPSAEQSRKEVASSANLITAILHSAPSVQIIVTSRERLRLRQEQVYPIQGLEFPDWETPEDAETYTAVQLFLQSARRNQPEFELQGTAELTYLARICRLVAGMPLALELAAAWVDMLSLEELAQELAAQGGRGLDLLESDFQDVPERHQSVRSTIDYSWHKLSEEEQLTFAKLATFRGGFNHQAGQNVTGASLAILTRLVKKSLIQVERQRKRYRIHELLRQYGQEKLAENEEVDITVSDRHAAYYCQALADRTDDLKGGRQKEALGEIEADIDNARAAWDWAVKRVQFELIQQAMFSLCRFYEWFGRIQEYREVLHAAIKQFDSHTVDSKQQIVVVDLLHQLASQAETPTKMHESLESAKRYLTELGRAELDCRPQQARQFLLSGKLHNSHGQYERAENSYKQSFNLYNELDKQWEKSHALLSLGKLYASKGHFNEAEKNVENSLSIANDLNDRATICLALQLTALIANNRGDGKRLQRYTLESIAIARELDLRYNIASLLADLGTYKMGEGQFSEAEQYHQESITLMVEMGYRRNVAWAMWCLGWDKLGARQVEEAKQWINKAINLPQEVGFLGGPSYGFFSLSIISLIERRYDEALNYAKKAARAAPATSSDAMGIALIALGWSHLVRENYPAAEYAFFKALQKRFFFSQWTFLPIAFLLIERAPATITLEEAWQLIGSYKYTAMGVLPLFNEFTAEFRPDQLLTLPQEQIDSTRERGRYLDLESTYDQLLSKLATLGWDSEEQETDRPHKA